MRHTSCFDGAGRHMHVEFANMIDVGSVRLVGNKGACVVPTHLTDPSGRELQWRVIIR